MPLSVYVPSEIGEGYFTDWQEPAAGATDNGKVWAYNSTTGKYEPTTISAGISNIVDADDFTDTTGAGTDGYSVTWDNDTGKFVLANVSGGGGGAPGGSDTQVQFNDGGAFGGDAGLTYDAANDALTVAGRLVVPVIRPAIDSTTSLKIKTAADADFVSFDTTNGRISLENQAELILAGNGSNIGSYKLMHSIGAGGSTARGTFYPVAANNNMTFYVVPSGSGIASISVFGTDFIADSSNFERMYWQTGGGKYSLFAQKAGSGLLRPIDIAATGVSGQLYLTTTGNVGIGTTSPNNLLDVAGTIQCNGLRIDATPTAETPSATHTAIVNFNGTNYKIILASA